MAPPRRPPPAGEELALARGMNANSEGRHPAAQQRHHRAVIAAMRWVAAIGALVIYLGGVRFLLQQAVVWLATSALIVRRALGCP